MSIVHCQISCTIIFKNVSPINYLLLILPMIIYYVGVHVASGQLVPRFYWLLSVYQFTVLSKVLKVLNVAEWQCL